MKYLQIVLCIMIFAGILSGCNTCTKMSVDNKSINEEQKEEVTVKVADQITWCSSFNTGLNIAREQNQLLMVDFTAQWCGWCRKLDDVTYKDKKVIQLSKEFICVKVDCDRDRTTPGRFNVRGLPTIIFLSPDGDVIHRVVGYRKPEDFIMIMKNVLNTYQVSIK
jgi:thiol:disulfide interchange protein DsbD